MVFEAGRAFGVNPRQTILVTLAGEPVRTPSDIAGRHLAVLGDDQLSRNDLVARLRTAGCPVNTAGNDWLSAGDFGNALPTGEPAPESVEGGEREDAGPVDVTEEELKILRVLAAGEESNEDFFEDLIARTLGIKLILVRHLIEGLQGKGLVDTSAGQTGRGWIWSLTSSGRRYLIENDLL